MPAPKLAFIGGGNMARAIIDGALRTAFLSPRDLAVVEPDDARRTHFASLGVAALSHCDALRPLLSTDTQLLLAVKPQSLAEVARDAGPLDLADRVVITILAGTPSPRVRECLGGRVRVVRAMPNLPAQLGRGCTAVALGEGARPGDDDLAIRLFSSVGPVVERIDESLMDAFTALAGSGPAYLFYLAEAMTRAGEALGFDHAVGDRVVRQVLTGSAALLAASPAQPSSALRAAVTSKGGTTEAACRVLDESRVMDAFLRALTAARDRGRELASGGA